MLNEGPSTKRVFLPRPLFCFWGVLVVVTLVSAARFLWLAYVNHVPVPEFILPTTKGLNHWDFTVFAHSFNHFRDPDFWSDKYYPFTYPATCGLAFEFFYKLPHPVLTYVSLLALAIVGSAWLWAARLRERGLSAAAAVLFVVAMMACYPVQFELQRANIEGIVILLTGASILTFFHRRYWLAATLIGIAAAMKIFPILLIGLLFSVRKYREMVWALVVAFIANLCSLWVLGPSIAVARRQIAYGIAMFQRLYVENTDTNRFERDHSLFTLVKLALVRSERGKTAQHLAHLAHAAASIYLAAMAVTGLLLFFFVIRKLPLLNQVLILCLCAVSLPPVSFDYTLLHLAVPFALLSLYAVDVWNAGERHSTALNTIMALFGLIFADLNLFGMKGELMGLTRAVAILILMVMLLRYPLRWQAFDQA